MTRTLANALFRIAMDRSDLAILLIWAAKSMITPAPINSARNVRAPTTRNCGNWIEVMSIRLGNTKGKRIIMYGEIKQVMTPAQIAVGKDRPLV